MADAVHELRTTCCIAGGGPAGLMLGYLLARAGVNVVVLEKHGDFLRDFRGDTIHPSTLELMHELGLLDALLTLPHDEMQRFEIALGDRRIVGPDFTHLNTRCRFVAFMPQWDFLNFLAAAAAKYSNFKLLMDVDVTGVLEHEGRVAGVQAQTPDGPLRVHALLTIAADGRASTLRSAAGMTPENLGVPIDALWLRVPKHGASAREALMHVHAGHLLIAIDRSDYWQCAFIIPKGAFAALRAGGLDAFKQQIAETLPVTRRGLEDVTSWDEVHLLNVQVNRLQQWYRDGLLCIGDAAHAMSPAGGVGINLAIQDAVAAANLLHAALREGRVTTAQLDSVQRRRERAARLIQRMQLFAHRRLLRPSASGTAIEPPRAITWLLPLVAPLLRRIGAHIVGIGFQPEHIAPAILARGRV